jgi:hypothetical protein
MYLCARGITSASFYNISPDLGAVLVFFIFVFILFQNALFSVTISIVAIV